MKKIVVTSLLTLILISSYGQTIRYDTIQYAPDHYHKRLALFQSEPITKGKIILLGNSITESGEWKKLLNDSGIINRGISGDNTFGVLARLDDVTTRQPAKLFVKIGINDVSQNIPNEIIIHNILMIVERVKEKSPTTRIYVQSILPTNDNTRNEHPNAFNKNHLIRSINEQIRRDAKTRRFTYIDLNKEFADKEGKLKPEYAESDGLHLNETGYLTWARLLKKKYL